MASDRPIGSLISEIADARAFGPDLAFVSYEPDDDRRTGQKQFASVVHRGTVTVGDPGGRRRQHRVVVKLKYREIELRVFIKNDLQFHNEKLFYERIMPTLLARAPAAAGEGRERVVPALCRYFYGRNDCGDRALQDLIVLENATSHGYRISDGGMLLDLDHVLVATEALAKFHGLSYRAKHSVPERFAEVVADIKETQWLENQWAITNVGYKLLFSVYMDRLAERRGDDGDERARLFREEFLGEALQQMRRLIMPSEPLAVLCHGDFNRNNLLFRYDDGGRPVDALQFDMATVRYGSPALDLSFFLYMNTDRSLREAHYDEILDTYCATLAAAVEDMAGSVRVPDRVQLDAEFRDYGFYGLMHVSFFVRIMMEEVKSLNLLAFTEIGEEECVRSLLMLGGIEATDQVADAIQHYLDVRYAGVL